MRINSVNIYLSQRSHLIAGKTKKPAYCNDKQQKHRKQEYRISGTDTTFINDRHALYRR
ncbi:hypothetical protein HMPREF1199_01569 [Hoylesella oralis CC98A]|nr:hypothetical protein HMPREF1199_01569 [Hoylesella oralis CC98A]